MKNRIHFSNYFINLEVFCERLEDPTLISELTKVVYDKTYDLKAFDKIFLLKNRRLLGKLLIDYTSSIALSTSDIIASSLNVSNCSTSVSSTSIQAET